MLLELLPQSRQRVGHYPAGATMHNQTDGPLGPQLSIP